MDDTLLKLLVCPLCKNSLRYEKKAKELICSSDRLAFQIQNDIPIMLIEEARILSKEEN